MTKFFILNYLSPSVACLTMANLWFKVQQNDSVKGIYIDDASDNGSYVRNLPNPAPLAL